MLAKSFYLSIYLPESKQVQTNRCKGNNKMLVDREEGKRMINNKYLSTNSETPQQVAKIRITPCSPGSLSTTFKNYMDDTSIFDIGKPLIIS